MSSFTYSYAFCSEWLTEIFVDCNGFNKGGINKEPIEWTFKEHMNKMSTDKMRTKLTETAPISPTGIHANKTKHQNEV